MAACLACAAPNPPIRCTGCRIARFCSKKCQRLAWSEHKPFCMPKGIRPVEARDIARSAASYYSGEVEEESFLPDAEVQAAVLEALGIWEGVAVLGQRPLADADIWEFVTQGKSGLARLLFGRNSFYASYVPMLRRLTQDTRWPVMLSARNQGHITELPTLELCAAVSVRVLCCARRLREAGQKRLIFVGIGSGDALVEASVALHLGTVLGQAVDLQAEPPLQLWYGDFEISIVATDTSDDNLRQQNQTQKATSEMPVLPLDRRGAVRRFAAEAPIYVFSSWMPMRAKWRADIEDDAGGRLAELCYLSAPPTLIKILASELKSNYRPTVQLFPRTLNRWDFLSRGLEDVGGEEAGFFHSQLYVLPDPTAAPPFLAPPLRHSFGSYAKRIDDNRLLKGINYCRALGLYHIHGPEDLDRQIPPNYVYNLRQSLLEEQLANDSKAVQDQIGDCKEFLTGSAYKEISALQKEMRQRLGG